MTMSLSDHPKLYGSAALTLAFVAGVVVTLGFKDVNHSYSYSSSSFSKRKPTNSRRRNSNASLLSTTTTTNNNNNRGSLFFGPPLQLEDHEYDHAETTGLATPVISDGIESTIGHTPLLRLKALSALTGRTLLAKAEFLNGCGGSPKDRVALAMIRTAEAQGRLVPHRGDTIYEGTVGSTGISLATLARARGYKCHICMPADVAIEKADLLRQLGATVERVTPAPITSPDHFVNLARRRAQAHADNENNNNNNNGSVGFFADQFESPANWTAHFRSTGPEIYAQTDNGRQLQAFVAGAGTGGTIAGVARYLKEEAQLGDAVRIVLADPQGSGLYNKVRYGVMYSPTEREGTRRRHQVDTIVEGIGITRITDNFEAGRELIDDAVRVTDEQACRMARWLVENEGVFAGSSSAVNVAAAVVTAMKLPPGSTVVTILCDSGQRHLSKFYKKIGEMGLDEEDHDPKDLFAMLGIEQPSM